MIGMVNVPCDSPIDFYASPKRTDSTYRQRPDNESAVPRTPTQKRTPSYRPLFTGNRIKIQYSEDGRKISDGVYLEQSEPNKLWEELLLRSFAHRIEDEIQSPVDSFKNLNEELAKLSVRDNSLYRSTYSLVSPNRVNGTEIDELNQINKKCRRSQSTDPPPCSILPFIKSIRGKKKGTKAK